MNDTDAFGIPTYVKEVESGTTVKATKDGSLKTGNTSQEPIVSALKEKDQAGAPKPSEDHEPTPIVVKIGELEKLLIDGKATLVDDDGHPIKKVDYPAPLISSTKRVNPFYKVKEIDVSDSDDEDITFDESTNLFGSGHDREDDYDEYEYDNYAAQFYDLPGNFKLQGLRRK